MKTAYQILPRPAHLRDSLPVLHPLQPSHQDNQVQALYTEGMMHDE